MGGKSIELLQSGWTWPSTQRHSQLALLAPLSPNEVASTSTPAHTFFNLIADVLL
jgi:hypothetical protein